MNDPAILARLRERGILINTVKKHPLYGVWVGMLARCNNPRRKDWPRYGGRGIKVCSRWEKSSATFLEDMAPSWEKGLSLDRIDPEEGYCPENCRWITVSENSRRRNNCLTSVKNRDIAKANGIAKATLGYRLRNGWPVDKAINVRPNHGNKCASL